MNEWKARRTFERAAPHIKAHLLEHPELLHMRKRELELEMARLRSRRQRMRDREAVLRLTLQATRNEVWNVNLNPEREQLIQRHMEHPNMLGGQGPEGRYTREQAEEAVDHMEKHAPLSLPQGIGRIVNSRGLAEINEESVRRNYNRTLSDDLIAKLDPDGTHVVGPIVIPHEHAQGRKVDPHIRAQFLIKTKDGDKPVETFLDMTLDHWQALPMIRKDEETGEYENISADDARETLLAQIANPEQT